MPAGDEKLPDFEPGAHIKISLPEGGERAYSLIDLEPIPDTEGYRIAVRLEEESTGGSRFMHRLSTGDIISATKPVNDFPLIGSEGPVTFLAGGIGITPITAMVSHLARSGKDYQLHYAGRSSDALAFVEPLRTIARDRLELHYDDAENALDLTAVINNLSPVGHIYVCGPRGMIDAAQEAARSYGFADDHIHFELFTNQVEAAAGSAFEIELASTGEVLPVPDGKSIIDVLEEAGHDVLYDCQRGDCGICQTEVISGVPDHRDVVLSDDEKASGSVMQICVSRSKTPRLVLDL